MTSDVRHRADARALPQRDPARQHDARSISSVIVPNERPVWRDDPLRQDVPRHVAEPGVHEQRHRGGVQHQADEELDAAAHGGVGVVHDGTARACARRSRSARTTRGATRAEAGAQPVPGHVRTAHDESTSARCSTMPPCTSIASMLARNGLPWNSHFWDSGLVTDRPPRRPPDLRHPPGRRARRVAAARARVRRPRRRPAGRDPVRRHPAEHPPARASASSPTRPASPAPRRPRPTGCCATRATWSAGAAPARSRRCPTGPGRARRRGGDVAADRRLVDLPIAAPSAPSSLHGAYLAALDAPPPPPHRDGYAPLGLPVAARGDRRTGTRRRGTPTTPDQVLVTTGAQQAIHLLVSAHAGPGDRVVVEHPTYPHAIEVGPRRRRPPRPGAVRRRRARHRPARVDAAAGRAADRLPHPRPPEPDGHEPERRRRARGCARSPAGTARSSSATRCSPS